MGTGDVQRDATSHEDEGNEAPTGFEHLLELGWAHFQADRLPAAIGAFRGAIDLRPGDARAHFAIGRAYLDDGQTEAALAALKRAIALDPEAVDPYISLGIVYMWRLGDYERAIEAFEASLARDRDHGFGRAQLGMTYAYAGWPDRALASLEETIRLQPGNERALENLSMVYLSLGRYEDVIATCRRHIEVNPDVNDPHRMMGYAYSRLGRYEDAIAALERAVALAPEIYEIRGALARALDAGGRRDEAVAHHDLAAELASKDDEFGRASFAAVCEDADTAVTLLKLALAQGQVTPGWLRVDPDLVFLRGDPRFEALMVPG